MKILAILALSTVLGVSTAYAERGGEGNNTGCNGRGNVNSPCEPSGGSGGNGGNGGTGGTGGAGGTGGNASQGQLQGQLQAQGQAQGQSSVNINKNASVAGATSGSRSTSGSSSNSNSSSNSGGNSLRTNVGVNVTGPNVSNQATGGESSATGGESVANSEINIHGDSYDYSAATAAAVFAQECQTGMSGQVEEGGFSVINTDQFCQHVKAARVALQAYDWEKRNQSQCTEIEYGYTTEGGADVIVETIGETCLSKKAQSYLSEYRHHTDKAISLVRATEEVGFIDTIAGYLVRPVALIAVLILLI